MKPPLCLTLFAAVAVILTSCSTPDYAPIDESQNATYQQGVPGGTVVETYDLNATVKTIDASARKVTLVTKDGEKITVKCGPEVINFDQIQVGDVVKATVTDQVTVAMANAGTPSPDSGTAVVLLTPKGAKPGGVIAETQQYTATITAIDLKKRRATLRFPDDTVRTFIVRKDVDLTQRKVGEKVTFKVTATTALSVTKP